MKVLIIDDEIDLCLLLKSYFQKRGFEVILSYSLLDGKEKIGEHKPDYLFLDYNLPDGLGWDIAPEVAIKYPTIKQFLISAYHPPIPQMPSFAVYQTLEKPISFSDLDTFFSDAAYNSAGGIQEY